MDPFQVSPFATSQPSKPPLLPQDALMVVDNRQLQVWSGINCWPPHPQDPQRHGAAATLVGLTASSAETPSTSASTSPVTEKKKKRVFKKRKATHTVRKEQKAALAKEIEQLQAQLDEIKFQALVQQGQASRSYHDRVVENAVLRESIQDQHLAMAQVRALLSTHTQHHMSGVRPMETKICLSADRAERRGVLHALRETKLRDAKRFLRARSNGINTNTPMATSLSTPQGSTSILDLMIAVQSDTHIGDPISSRTRSGDVTRCPAKSQEQSDAINSDAQEQKQKKQVFKKRKATHTLRKEEKEALEVEVQVLKAKLDALKLQALVQRDDTDSTLNRRIAHNTVLREVVQKQHVVLAHTQGMLVGCAQRHSYEVRPTEMYIHLTADRYERHETLKALREHKLFYARRFIQQRSLGMHPTAEYLHEERYETPEGDYCNVRFDRVPLRGVRGGIRAVLDALKQAAFNAEIIISETSGNLTIREDDDLAEKDCSQLRLVTQTNRGVLLENNLVHFTDFSSAGGSDSYAITTTDFVDEDELLPYLPDQRVRRDATTAILVTSHADTQSDDVDGPAHTKKRVYKKRKSTHTVRKEERLALEEELETLKTKLDALKLRALIHSGDEAASLHKQMAQNSGLQESIQEHHLVVANAQAMLYFWVVISLNMASIGAHYMESARSATARRFPSRFQHQDSAEDDSEAYGADRHAAAALRGFAVRAKDDKDEDVTSEPCAGATPAKKKRIYKKRKATHTIRKEEKQALESEIQKLQKQLEMLKFKTLVENGNEPHSDKKQLAKGAWATCGAINVVQM
ncbi:hypothetical protein KRP22_007283 [Phytophthora ramorum]|nr:hypothetical protein KRP22_4706 [Phytophthora ramorum]